jgi:hypothetical protein
MGVSTTPKLCNRWMSVDTDLMFTALRLPPSDEFDWTTSPHFEKIVNSCKRGVIYYHLLYVSMKCIN